jgi:sRNA-binding carbon storage regulator CsrA
MTPTRLTITRKQGEAFNIIANGEIINVRIVKSTQSDTKLRITAPRHIIIAREKGQANRGEHRPLRTSESDEAGGLVLSHPDREAAGKVRRNEPCPVDSPGLRAVHASDYHCAQQHQQSALHMGQQGSRET